jgi:uncharacterized protein
VPETRERESTYGFFASRAAERYAASRENEILRVRVGSRMYGTARPDSDEDYYAVWMPTKEQMLGLGEVTQYDTKDVAEDGKTVVEVKRYPFHLFIKHALKNNPNFLEALFADEANILFETEAGKRLREARNMFPSRRVCLNTFLGYAQSQRKKLTFKRERIAEFVKVFERVKKLKAEHVDKLPERITVNSEINEMKWWRIYEKGERVALVYENIVKTLEEYGWRRKLIEKFGWDTKFASHLIRILSEGFDLFHTGKITFPLKCRKEINEIRDGKWTMQEVLDASEQWEKRLKDEYDKSDLQMESDYAEIDKLLVNTMDDYWAGRIK